MRYFFISSYYRFIYKIKKALGFTSALEDILGFTIKRKDLYKEAFIHRSVSTTTNNERLEFLGDSVLQSIVSHYIFRKFPTFKEGELTVLRSKIVRRKTLNKIGEELGLDRFIESENLQGHFSSAEGDRVLGDSLEALIGALYLDRKYSVTRYFILNRILRKLLDFAELKEEETNPKGRLIEWAQQNKQMVSFQTTKESRRNGRDFFEVSLAINGNIVCIGEGFSKRAAEHHAALQILDDISAMNLVPSDYESE